ncbi:MAG: T9SS type B sorting domain-containing protein [Paludibacteraceae bacterium]|nr:T9SS type B sorting domain-containing protein [Paludibacteraceae bacterium]
MQNHKNLLSILSICALLTFSMGMSAQSCPDTFSGTTFQPKSGVKDNNYDLESVKFSDPSSESLTTSMKFTISSTSITQGQYTVTKDGFRMVTAVSGDAFAFFTYTINDLVTTSGKNSYKISIDFEIANGTNCSCTKECHRGINFKHAWVDNGGNKDEYKEYQNGKYTWTKTFTAKDSKATIVWSADHANNCKTLIVKSIKVTGCVDKKIVSENGSKVCAGEENAMIAKGLNGTCKWEISKDNKQTWQVIEGATESVVTVAITDECYFRCTCGGDVLVSDVVRPVVCCSVAGTREDVMKVDFSSNSLNSTNRVNFGQLNDSKSQGITSTYTYVSSGNVDENGYIITTLPKNGGYWSDSEIKDHTTGGTDSHNGFLLVNCGKEDKRMFEYQISSGDFCKNTVYDFSAYIANIDANTASNHEPVNAGFQVYGVAPRKQDVLLLDTETGDLPYTGDWVEKGESFNSGDYTTFKLIIKNNHVSQSTGAVIGNDIGIDDITFSTCSPEVKIYTDSKYTTQDTIVCDDGKTVHLRLEAHAVYDLSTFFKTPYFLFQTSTDLSSWDNVLDFATTDDFVEIDVEKTSLYESGLWYRVWVGGDKDAVEKSAGDGKPGTGCGKLTAVAEPILIKYQCQCSPTDAPTAKDYAACPVSGTKLLRDQVTSTYDNLRFYETETGGTDLGKDATFDASVVGIKTYYVTNQKATDASGLQYCESPRTPINIEVKGSATVSPSDINICFTPETPDSELTFVASPTPTTFEYTWKSTEGPSIDAKGATYTLARQDAKGKITVTATDPTGAVCPGTASVSYVTAPNPSFTLSAPSMVCLTSPSAIISAELTLANGTYTWKKNGTDVESGTVTSTTLTYTDPSVSTVSGDHVEYSLNVVNINMPSCESNSSIIVEVGDRIDIPLVATDPVVDNRICVGSKFDVNANYTLGAGETLSWSVAGAPVPGVTGKTLSAQEPTEDTEYTVSLAGNVCPGGGTLTIGVDKPVNPVIASDADVVCAGTAISITDSDAETASQYIWYKDGALWTEYSSKDITSYVPTATATYKKEAKNGLCTSESNEIRVEVQPEIAFDVSPLGARICEGGEVEIEMSRYPEGSTLEWIDNSTGQSIATTAKTTVKPEATTTYTASVTKICKSSKELTITVLDPINPTITDDLTICEGSNKTIEASGTNVTSIVWSPATGLSGTTGARVTASPTITTKYKAVLDNGYCTDSAFVTVKVSSLPRVATINITGETCLDRGISVSGKKGTPPYMFSLDGKNFTTDTEFTGLGSGYKIIYIQDSEYCQSDTTFQLDAYAIRPDIFFTPNEDGVNDTWKIANIDCYEGYIVEIFDRYGKRIYVYKKGSFSGGSVTDDFPGWDGYYNGHQMSSDDYWYLITVEEIRKQYNGHFILKR